MGKLISELHQASEQIEADMSYLHFIPVWRAISAAKRFGSLKCMEDCWLFDILDFSSVLFSWLF